MNEQQILEGTKIISRFVSINKVAYSENGDLIPSEFCNDNLSEQTYFDYKDMKFHTSYGWIMPVVEKIESLFINGSQSTCKIKGVFVEIVHEVGYRNIDFACNSRICEDNQIGGRYHYNGSKIENIYKVVIEFIKWYNANNIHQKEN